MFAYLAAGMQPPSPHKFATSNRNMAEAGPSGTLLKGGRRRRHTRGRKHRKSHRKTRRSQKQQQKQKQKQQH